MKVIQSLIVAALAPIVLSILVPAMPSVVRGADTDLALKTEGLHYEEVLNLFFEGNFVDIPFDRDETLFVLLFNSYLTTYASHCTKHLPEDKIELTREECAREEVTTNGLGVELSRVCIEWVTVGTGLYAAPEMHHANVVLDGIQAGDAFRTMFRMLAQEDPLGSTMSLVANAQAAEADMISLIRLNGCESPGLMRLQENLRLFALNKPPIRLGHEDAPTMTAALSSTDQDFGKLVEDLVLAHSKSWVMNKYRRGSVAEVTLTSMDAQNRPAEVHAKYTYQGLLGESVGSVRVTFRDGLPECLYFHDFPATCRTADRRISAQYSEGEYLNP